MIQSFKHAGLKRFFEEGRKKGIPTDMISRLERRLGALDLATGPFDLGQVEAYRLHQLKGARQGEWAIWVTGSWRLTFRFESHNVVDLDLEDYH